MGSISLAKQASFYLYVAAGIGAATLAIGAAYLVTSLLTYNVILPMLLFQPPIYYDGDQFVLPLESAVIDIHGRVRNYTEGTNSTIDGFAVEAGGEAVDVEMQDNEITIQLRPRAGVEGSYVCADVTVTLEGIATTVENGLPIDAADVTGAQAALSAQFLTSATATPLTGHRVLAHGAGFVETTATPGEFGVALAPSAVAGQNCTHMQSIEFGSGLQIDSCVSGPAPGTPGGPATLGMDGIVESSQLTPVFTTDYFGLWDASTDTPTVVCGATDRFYYFVSVDGNTTKGSFSVWRAKDVLLCINGTIDRIESVAAGVLSFAGRTSVVDSVLGDYSETDIPFGGGTLQDVINAPLVLTQSDPDLPAAQVLTPVAGETTLADGVVGLADVPFWNQTSNVLSGALKNLQVDQFGRAVYAESVPGMVRRVFGTENQVIILDDTLTPQPSATGNLSVTIPQTTSRNETVRFNSVSVNGSVITCYTDFFLAAVWINSQTAYNYFVQTEGAFTLHDNIAVNTQLKIASSAGIRINNAGNNGSLTLRPAPATTGDNDLSLPNSYGAAGALLARTGASETVWQPNVAFPGWVAYPPGITILSGLSAASNIATFRRGLGTSGSIMQVVTLLSLTRTSTVSTALTITLPVASVGGWTDGFQPRGICQQAPTGYGFNPSGYAVDYFDGPAEMLLVMRQGAGGPLNVAMMCNFFYRIP